MLYSLSPVFCIFPGVFAALGAPALVVGAQSVVGAASQPDGDASMCREEGAALFVIGLLWSSVAICSASFFLAVGRPSHTAGVWTYRSHFALALAELAAFLVTMVLTIKELEAVFTSSGLCSLESSEGKVATPLCRAVLCASGIAFSAQAVRTDELLCRGCWSASA